MVHINADSYSAGEAPIRMLLFIGDNVLALMLRHAYVRYSRGNAIANLGKSNPVLTKRLTISIWRLIDTPSSLSA